MLYSLKVLKPDNMTVQISPKNQTLVWSKQVQKNRYFVLFKISPKIRNGVWSKISQESDILFGPN